MAGGVLSPQRDGVLSTRLRPRVRAGARTWAILVRVDGLASSVTACRRVFRDPVPTGRPGRPRLVLEKGWLLGHMVTRLHTEVETLRTNPFDYTALTSSQEHAWFTNMLRHEPRLWSFVLHRSPATPELTHLQLMRQQ